MPCSPLLPPVPSFAGLDVRWPILSSSAPAQDVSVPLLLLPPVCELPPEQRENTANINMVDVQQIKMKMYTTQPKVTSIFPLPAYLSSPLFLF
mmetsp:Transcript_56966/g.120940  ORF Transcript_56966/g.120940 Transcript_56966/m.120940 type:complete len:93 (-) Transcript_56966:276-554(-)